HVHPLEPRAPLGPRMPLGPRAPLGPRMPLGPRAPLGPRPLLREFVPSLSSEGHPVSPLQPPISVIATTSALQRARFPVGPIHFGAKAVLLHTIFVSPFRRA